MQGTIKEIFVGNAKLLGLIDKAIIYFREGRYDLALEMIAATGDGIDTICSAIISNREYFKLVSTESVEEMLEGILEAKKQKDYVLLADLYEMQLTNFICNVQELILKSEDYLVYDEIMYAANIRGLEAAMDRGMELLADEESLIKGSSYDAEEAEDRLTRLRVNRNAEIEAPVQPEELLSKGYGIEFTSCGLMTMRAPHLSGEPIYMHTNGKILTESFLLARSWVKPNVDTYIIYGYGMGYHVSELRKLAPSARILVFESDINVLKLNAAFASEPITDRGLYLVYDPDRTLVEERISRLAPNERAYVHYPSFRRFACGPAVNALVPWSTLVEEC